MDAKQEGIACLTPLQWGQSFDFWGGKAGCFRYTVCKQEKMGTINSTTNEWKIWKWKVTLIKREKIGIIFNWDIFTMRPLYPTSLPAPPKKIYNMTA